MPIEYTELNNLGYKVIEKNADGAISWIPIDEANSDYQTYLRWLENPEADNGTIS